MQVSVANNVIDCCGTATGVWYRRLRGISIQGNVVTRAADRSGKTPLLREFNLANADEELKRPMTASHEDPSIHTMRMENWLDTWSNATKRFIDMSHSMPVA